MMERVRWIELNGAVNVRDLGGLPTTDGRKTVRGRVLRADNLQDLTPEDVSLLVDELSLRTVVDLRTPDEVAAEGPGPLVAAAVAHTNHSLLLASAGRGNAVSPEQRAERRQRINDRYPGDYMTGSYLCYLDDRPDSVVAALRAIARSQGAAIVHCAAGKDRTGVISALALQVAGVDADSIVADYTATAERIGRVLTRLRSTPTYASDVDRVPEDAHTPRAETMAAFLSQVDSEFGGAAGYLSSHGFSDDELRLLRSRLVDA